MTARASTLNVLMVLDGAYPPLKGGGTEMQVRTLARGLRQRGHHVTVLAPLIRERSQARTERDDGVAIVRLPFPRVRLLGGAWLLVSLYVFLLSRRNRYDAWHVHSPRQWGAVAAWLGSRCEKPEVVVKVASAAELEHGTLSHRPTWWRRAQYLGLKRADAWQAISRRIASGIAERGIPSHRIAAIPNAVDTTRFCPRQSRPASHPVFVFVGRLVNAKNLPLLLDAFAALLVTHPRAVLRIVGGGPLEASLVERACTLGIASQVQFTGHRTDIEELLADASFGVLTSSVEGLSNTLLECMACGLPMIASRVSGSEDLVRTGANGWLFEPGDGDALLQCLVEAASLSPDQRLQLGTEARACIERYAGLDSVMDQILRLYRGSDKQPGLSLTSAREAR